jgi:hypothetical protein
MFLAATVFGILHLRGERRGMVGAITHQIDGHAPKIAEILGNLRGSNVTFVETAVFQELQTIPSTSLIARTMVKVAPSNDGHLECVIDTSSMGIPPRTIWSSPQK